MKGFTITLTDETHARWLQFCRVYFGCKSAGKNNGANKVTSELVEKHLIKIMEGQK